MFTIAPMLRVEHIYIKSYVVEQANQMPPAAKRGRGGKSLVIFVQIFISSPLCVILFPPWLLLFF